MAGRVARRSRAIPRSVRVLTCENLQRRARAAMARGLRLTSRARAMPSSGLCHRTVRRLWIRKEFSLVSPKPAKASENLPECALSHEVYGGAYTGWTPCPHAMLAVETDPHEPERSHLGRRARRDVARLSLRPPRRRLRGRVLPGRHRGRSAGRRLPLALPAPRRAVQLRL